MPRIPWGRSGFRSLTGGGGPERSGSQTGGKVVDPLEQQVTYLAGDRNRVPDEKLADEIKQLHPTRSNFERGLIELAVLDLRHPELKIR